jgi:hypothetical protein
VIQVTLFKPETAFARANAAQPGLACLQVTVKLPDDKLTYDHRWLTPAEMHCPFDPKWLHEHVSIVWRNVLDAVMPSDIVVIEKCSPARCEVEKFLNREHRPDDGGGLPQ